MVASPRFVSRWLTTASAAAVMVVLLLTVTAQAFGAKPVRHTECRNGAHPQGGCIVLPSDPQVKEADQSPPVRVVPRSGSGSGGPSTLAYPQRYSIDVPTGDWTTVRSGVGTYFIGSGADGWQFDAVGPSANGFWRLGLLYGNYLGCGWILAENLTPVGGGASTQCSQWSIGTNQFSNGQFNCTSPCDGPRSVITTAGVAMCMNAKPWLVPDQPTECWRYIPAGSCVEWRYVSRSGARVAIKLRGVPDPQGSWGFIGREALPAVLPTGQIHC